MVFLPPTVMRFEANMSLPLPCHANHWNDFETMPDLHAFVNGLNEPKARLSFLEEVRKEKKNKASEVCRKRRLETETEEEGNQRRERRRINGIKCQKNQSRKQKEDKLFRRRTAARNKRLEAIRNGTKTATKAEKRKAAEKARDDKVDKNRKSLAHRTAMNKFERALMSMDIEAVREAATDEVLARIEGVTRKDLEDELAAHTAWEAKMEAATQDATTSTITPPMLPARNESDDPIVRAMLLNRPKRVWVESTHVNGTIVYTKKENSTTELEEFSWKNNEAGIAARHTERLFFEKHHTAKRRKEKGDPQPPQTLVDQWGKYASGMTKEKDSSLLKSFEPLTNNRDQDWIDTQIKKLKDTKAFSEVIYKRFGSPLRAVWMKHLRTEFQLQIAIILTAGLKDLHLLRAVFAMKKLDMFNIETLTDGDPATLTKLQDAFLYAGVNSWSNGPAFIIGAATRIKNHYGATSLPRNILVDELVQFYGVGRKVASLLVQDGFYGAIAKYLVADVHMHEVLPGVLWTEEWKRKKDGSICLRKVKDGSIWPVRRSANAMAQDVESWLPVEYFRDVNEVYCGLRQTWKACSVEQKKEFREVAKQMKIAIDEFLRKDSKK